MMEHPASYVFAIVIVMILIWAMIFAAVNVGRHLKQKRRETNRVRRD